MCWTICWPVRWTWWWRRRWASSSIVSKGKMDSFCWRLRGKIAHFLSILKFQSFFSTFSRFANTLSARFFKFWLHPDFCFERSANYSDFIQDRDVILSFCRNVLTTLQTDPTVKVEQSNSEGGEGDKQHGFINQLMKISKNNDAFNDGDVIGETITAVLAVSDLEVKKKLQQLYLCHFRVTKRRPTPSHTQFCCWPCILRSRTMLWPS
jgi:hypothetical protein